MGRKCSTVFNNESCTSGYATNTEKTRIFKFPSDPKEKESWLMALPNVIDKVTENMGICEKHWIKGYPYLTLRGGNTRPSIPPTEFGNIPKSMTPQAVNSDRHVDQRGIMSEKRRNMARNSEKKKDAEKDTISSWDSLVEHCKTLSLAVEANDKELRLLKVSGCPLTVSFSIVVGRDFKVIAYKGAEVVNVRHLIDSFNVKLTLYSQIQLLVDYLETVRRNIFAEFKSAGNDLSKLNEEENNNIEVSKQTQIEFLCKQMIQLGAKHKGHRYEEYHIRKAMNIFFRSRNCYNALRKYLVLPCDNTLRNYFGKLGTVGSMEECKTVVKNVFDELHGLDKVCFITADEIYVKPAVRYRANHIIGMAVDQEPPKPARTVLAFMLNFLFGTPAFVARLLPVLTLKSDFLLEQVMLLMQTIHEVGGVVFLVMTDNLSVNTKMFKLLHETNFSHSIASIEHPFENSLFNSCSLFFDPTHAFKNIRNNWITEKTQTLDFEDPDTNIVVQAKWSDLKSIYREEEYDLVKKNKLDYRTLFPNNFEKQKVGLVVNVFNEKTIAALQMKGLDGTEAFVRQITRMWHIINVKSPEKGIRLNDPDRLPITDPNDSRLDFLLKMATSLKKMDNAKKGHRIRSLTADTANAWHVTLTGMVEVTRKLLILGASYILLGKLQSDRLEGEFGIYRETSGGNYLISVEQVLNSLSLQRLKLYHKLHAESGVTSNENACCNGKLEDKDLDIEILERCFDDASHLSESERSTLYFISGYVAFKENIGFGETTSNDIPESEFTNLVSRNKLSHPPSELYDLSLYIYSFFKARSNKCCTKIFLQAYEFIYESTGYSLPNISSILKRFNNCFFKAYASSETDKIVAEKDKKQRIKRKLNS